MKKLGLIFMIFCTALISMPELVAQNSPRVAFVFSGGGARGLAHIGALKVLEQEGIVPDYIGGASMGSIVGALYASGYNAEEIEFIVTQIDWEELLTDYISRRDLAMNEKDRFLKYALNFPLRKGGLELPKSLSSGQNISKMLSRLLLVQNDVNDFSQLPIPFLCTSTDLRNGDAIVFKEGYLPEIVRASMSIPTIFTPKRIDKMLLVDGGVTNNFPVQEVKNNGADIVIGMNVEMPSDDAYLNSFTRIMEQAIFLGGRQRNELNRELCDILIEYDLRDYSAGDFAKVEELIKIGEEQARKALPEIKKLIASKNIQKRVRKNTVGTADIPDKFQINKVKVLGNKRVSQRMVKAKLKIRNGKEVSLSQIEKGIDRVYGSDFFETATYQLEKQNNEFNLLVNVVEKDANVLRVSSHYDSDYQAALLMNLTFRNFIFRSSKLYFDAQLSMNPILNGKFYINILKRPELNLAVTSRTEYLDLSQHADTFSVLGLNKFFNHQSAAQVEFGIGNALQVAGGLEFQTSDFYLQEGLNQLDGPSFRNYNYFLNVDWDTYDRISFPTKGSKLTVSGKLLTGNLDQDPKQESIPYAYVRYSKVIQFFKRFYAHGYLWASYVGDKNMLPYYAYAGSMGMDTQPFIPFVGIHAGEVVTDQLAVARLDLSFRFFDNHYFTFHNNVLSKTLDTNTMQEPNNWLYGTGLSYDYNSLVGPIGITIMTSDLYDTPFAYVHVGFSF